jgi:hypothetical protein
MQPTPKAPRTPATGHDTYRTGARRSPKPSAQCENGPSHQTQYPRFHETVHALGVGYAEYGRGRAEVIVDTATAIACSSVGLRVDGDSIPYIAGWGETGELDAVTAFAKTIDELARRVETVLAAETAAESLAA